MRTRLIPFAAVVALTAGAWTTATAQAGGHRPATATGDVATTKATPAPALDDPTIVAIFDAANTADIETGQLAAKRGSTKAVREFGAMLARDHTAVRQQGRDLAKKLGVTPTPPADSSAAVAHAKAMRMLRSKRGAAFDRAFLDHEVQYHQAVIDAVQSTLLPSIQNAEVKALVVKVAPAFVAHRDMAANLRQKEGVQKAGN
jgi:putative membrane protein